MSRNFEVSITQEGFWKMISQSRLQNLVYSFGVCSNAIFKSLSFCHILDWAFTLTRISASFSSSSYREWLKEHSTTSKGIHCFLRLSLKRRKFLFFVEYPAGLKYVVIAIMSCDKWCSWILLNIMRFIFSTFDFFVWVLYMHTWVKNIYFEYMLLIFLIKIKHCHIKESMRGKLFNMLLVIARNFEIKR